MLMPCMPKATRSTTAQALDASSGKSKAKAQTLDRSACVRIRCMPPSCTSKAAHATAKTLNVIPNVFVRLLNAQPVTLNAPNLDAGCQAAEAGAWRVVDFVCRHLCRQSLRLKVKA